MIRFLCSFVFLVGLGVSNICFAKGDCLPFDTQLEYKQCLSKLVSQLEGEMTVHFQQALGRAGMRRDYGELREQYKKAQIVWQQYAEEECQAAFDAAAPGFDASTAFSRCRIKLLRQRIENLQMGY